MPLLDLAPSRVTLDDQGFELRCLGKTTRVQWNEIRSVHIDARATVRTFDGTVQVPRNSRGYFELFERFTELGVVSLPRRVEWDSLGTSAALVVVGLMCVVGSTLVPASLGNASSFVEWTVFLLGLAQVGVAPFAWERYCATEGHLERRSLFGTQSYSSAVTVGWGQVTVLGYPWLFVFPGNGGYFQPRGAKAELVAARIAHPPPTHIPFWYDGRTWWNKSATTQHPWVIWLCCLPWCALAPTHASVVGSFFGLSLIALLLSGGAFFVQFRPGGFWRFTLIGVRWNPKEDFRGVRFGTQFALVRLDGTELVLMRRPPVDWILRNWLPNPEPHRAASYRDVVSRTNYRGELRSDWRHEGPSTRVVAARIPNRPERPRTHRKR